MKNNILKGLLSLILITMTLPAQSQDFINIFFKNGDTRKFYLNEIIEFKASKKDADGVQHNDYEYQYIKTLSDEYFYRIEDVESISFAKRNEVLEEQNFVNAMTSVFPIINECSGINDVESHLDAIKTAEGVEHAWTDDHQLYIEIEEGEILSFHFDHNELVDESSIENIDSEAKALASKISRLIKPDGSRLKFAIANQQDKDESRNGQKLSYFLPLVSALKGCGIDVDYISSPSVEFFYDNSDNPSDHLNFYDYDAVILSTHGSYSEYINYDFWFGDSYGPKVHSISLSDDLFKEEYESDDIVPNWHDNFKTFKKWRKKLNLKDVTDQHISYSFNKETRGGKKYWVAHPNLSELFFRDIAPGDFKNPNSIFFNCACQSLKENNSFAEELINNHGLGVYAGYTESNYFGQLSSHTLFSKMFSTISLEKAYQELPSYMRHETFFNINISSDFDIDDKVYYQKNGVAGAELKILPENDSSVEELFILPVYTNFTSQENIIEEYNKSQTVKLSGTLTCLTAVKDVELGFLYGSGSIPTQKIEATSITNIFNLGKGNYTFTAELSNLEPGNTYFYRAYSFDGMNYNYGEPCSFEIPAQSADEKQVMLTQNVGGTTYEIYKINTDKNDYHINPDGWKCYKSSLMLDMTKNGKTSTYTLDDNIYLDSSESHHGGQRPCLYLSSSSDQLFIFINSKDSRNNYTMDGYAYRTSLSNVSFTRETVFTGRNWGWSPYFTYSDGVLSVQHFSYAGYYAMTSYRNSDGTWTTQQGSSIKPDAFNEQSEQAGNVLIEGNSGGGDDIVAYTSCPDSHHPHLIDLGLPSGTKWACCNVGAEKPEDYGGYFAWGETAEKSSYTTYNYLDEEDIGKDIAGTQYDAATVNWGSPWVMPSKEQMKELKNNCTKEWTTENGVNGRRFTGPNGASVFLPAAGNRWDDDLDNAGSDGLYWSSTLDESYTSDAWNLYFVSGDMGVLPNYRNSGQSVRPVRK